MNRSMTLNQIWYIILQAKENYIECKPENKDHSIIESKWLNYVFKCSDMNNGWLELASFSRKMMIIIRHISYANNTVPTLNSQH